MAFYVNGKVPLTNGTLGNSQQSLTISEYEVKIALLGSARF